MSQFLRFLVVGALNTLLGYGVIFSCMYLAGMSPEASNVSGYAVGLLASYVLNRNYTFKSKQNRRIEIIRFLAVFAAAFTSNFAFLLLLIHKAGMHEGLSQILAGIVYVAVSFFMNKYFVFRIPSAG